MSDLICAGVITAAAVGGIGAWGSVPGNAAEAWPSSGDLGVESAFEGAVDEVLGRRPHATLAL